jgi:cytochrome c553
MNPAGSLRTLALLALCFAGSPIPAQVQVALPTTGELKAALNLPGDVKRGRAAYTDCQGCHRRDGSGRPTLFTPRLSGQHASVILKQIMDIRSGARLNPPMKPVVEEEHLTAQTFADIAAFLQSLPVTGVLEKGPGTGVAQGQALYTRDCAGCHGERAEGRAELFHPMLASQHHGYLLRELGLIRDGRRGNSNPAMVQIVQGYTPADLQAVADYLSNLPPPR